MDKMTKLNDITELYKDNPLIASIITGLVILLILLGIVAAVMIVMIVRLRRKLLTEENRDVVDRSELQQEIRNHRDESLRNRCKINDLKEITNNLRNENTSLKNKISDYEAIIDDRQKERLSELREEIERLEKLVNKKDSEKNNAETSYYLLNCQVEEMRRQFIDLKRSREKQRKELDTLKEASKKFLEGTTDAQQYVYNLELEKARLNSELIEITTKYDELDERYDELDEKYSALLKKTAESTAIPSDTLTYTTTVVTQADIVLENDRTDEIPNTQLKVQEDYQSELPDQDVKEITA